MRAEKALKALKKQVRKNNKLLKEWTAAAEKAAREAAEKAAAEKATREAAEKAAAEKATSNKNAMQFLVDLGKAVCKAVPGILTALATAAIGYFFGLVPHKKGGQTGRLAVI